MGRSIYRCWTKKFSPNWWKCLWSVPKRNFPRLWWAEDGAPGHRARKVRNWLLELFQHKVIALYHESECDYFLWGFLKKSSIQYTSTHSGLRQRIITEVDAVKRNRMLVRRSVRDMRRRAHLCISRDGGRVEGNHVLTWVFLFCLSLIKTFYLLPITCWFYAKNLLIICKWNITRKKDVWSSICKYSIVRSTFLLFENVIWKYRYRCLGHPVV